MTSRLNLVKPWLLACALAACSGNDDTADNEQAEDASKAACSTTTASDPVVAKEVARPSAACAFQASLAWTSPLAANEDMTARLTFARKDLAAPQTVTAVAIDPQMPSMGHGTSTEFQEITADASRPYAFDVKGVTFIMGGKWVVHVKAAVDGVEDEVAFPVDIP